MCILASDLPWAVHIHLPQDKFSNLIVKEEPACLHTGLRRTSDYTNCAFIWKCSNKFFCVYISCVTVEVMKIIISWENPLRTWTKWCTLCMDRICMACSTLTVGAFNGMQLRIPCVWRIVQSSKVVSFSVVIALINGVLTDVLRSPSAFLTRIITSDHLLKQKNLMPFSEELILCVIYLISFLNEHLTCVVYWCF